MDEPFDRQTVLLSALWSGLGQLASGQTNKGVVLLALGTLTGTLGGVTGLLLRVLTFGRLKILPGKLNRLAVVWLAVYLYNLYDAYNLATGAEEDEDLFEYEEYEPQTPVETLTQAAGRVGDTVAQVAGQAKDTAAQVAGQAQDAASQVAGQAKDTASQVAGQAQNAASQVADRAKDTASQVVGQAQDSVGRVADQAKDTVSQATDQAKDAASQVSDRAKDAASQAAHQVQDTVSQVADQAQDKVSQVADQSQDTSANPDVANIAGHTPDIFSGPSAAPSTVAQAGAGGTPDARGSDLANVGNAVANLDQAASPLAAGDQSVGQGRVAGNAGPVGATEPAHESVTGVPPATTAGPHAVAEANREFEFSTLGIPWDAGVTKAQLLDMLGDDEQVLGVFGQYLPSDRVFHSEEEVLTLIPVQAWQDAQGRRWTGGELPNSDQPTGYGESAAGRLPPGDTTNGTGQ